MRRKTLEEAMAGLTAKFGADTVAEAFGLPDDGDWGPYEVVAREFMREVLMPSQLHVKDDGGYVDVAADTPDGKYVEWIEPYELIHKTPQEAYDDVVAMGQRVHDIAQTVWDTHP